VLLFQLVTGRLPFEGQTPLHTATLHIHEDPPAPSTLAPGIDERLEAVILKALAKKPSERHPTARHLGATLRKLLPELSDVSLTKVPISRRQLSSLNEWQMPPLSGGISSRPMDLLPTARPAELFGSAKTMVAELDSTGAPPAVVVHDEIDLPLPDAPPSLPPEAPEPQGPDSDELMDSTRTIIRASSPDDPHELIAQQIFALAQHTHEERTSSAPRPAAGARGPLQTLPSVDTPPQQGGPITMPSGPGERPPSAVKVPSQAKVAAGLGIEPPAISFELDETLRSERTGRANPLPPAARVAQVPPPPEAPPAPRAERREALPPPVPAAKPGVNPWMIIAGALALVIVVLLIVSYYMFIARGPKGHAALPQAMVITAPPA
jgi:serine/threonine-protein kinase